MRVSLDFETYSEADLGACGAWVYSEHPSTAPLCLAYAIDDGDPVLWTPDQEPPRELFEAAAAGAEFHAWNSFFEWCVWHLTCRWPAIPIAQWHDSAARAAMAALPRALAACGAALGMPVEQSKSKRGQFLIQRCCMPYRGRRVADAWLLQELYEYCRQDVIAERAIAERLPALPAAERAVWELDQTINLRGIGIDLPRVDDALAIAEQIRESMERELAELTGGALTTTRQVGRVLWFLAARGLAIDTLDRATVAEHVAEVEDDVARRVLEIRQTEARSSTAKYGAMRACAAADGRAHGLLRYHGAATGRWAGALVQPQNLPRPTIDDPDLAIGMFPARDARWLAAVWGCPMAALASCLRGMIVPRAGHRLLVADYSSIEPRVLAWLSGQDDVLRVFREGGDLYRYAAGKIYRKAPEEVTFEERFVGKVATLALGYGGGVAALVSMARAYGVDIPEDRAAKIRDDWREANPEVVRFWRRADGAAIACVRSGVDQGVREIAREIRFGHRGQWLTLRLPSGRRLYYHGPALINRDDFADGRFPGASYQNVEYSGVDGFTRQWTRIRTYGGKLVENIVQAVARDVMAEAMLRVERAGYPVVLTVHDELVAEVPEGHGSVEEFVRLLCDIPTWADGLPVAAVGQELSRYGK